MFKKQEAQRQQVKLKIGISGASGSGKTYSALLMAYGICGDWSKICLIDTENGSASLYSDSAEIGKFNVINFEAPFTPSRYAEAINIAMEGGTEVVIIDSISHERNGKGGILEMKDEMTGNDFAKRGKLTKLHNKFWDKILQSDMDFICCGRSKTQYVLSENSRGKMVPEKVGMGLIQREGADYEFTMSFDLDKNHNAVVSKDRTGGLLNDNEFFKIDESIGKKIKDWVMSGKKVQKPDPLLTQKDIITKALEEGETKKTWEAKINGSKKLSDEEKKELIDFINNYS